jgi:hypothetical protein
MSVEKTVMVLYSRIGTSTSRRPRRLVGAVAGRSPVEFVVSVSEVMGRKNAGA